jgi:hypothetical protein
MTLKLDDAIKQLQELREQIGGDAQVRYSMYGVQAMKISDATIGKVAKKNGAQIVSRGGVPVVLFTR